MMATKLVCLMLLAVGASQAAHIPAQSRDLIVVAEKVIQIFKIIGDQLSSGIEEARPIIINLEKELQPDLAVIVHKLLTDLESSLNRIVKRIKYLEEEIEAAIDQLNKTIPDCVKSVDAALDKVLDPAEKNISVLWRSTLAENNDVIADIIQRINETVTYFDAANDKGISNGLKCATPGSANVKECLDANTAEWRNSLGVTVNNTKLILNDTLTTLGDVVSVVLTQLQEIGKQIDVVSDPIWVDFGTCVANTKS